MFQVRNPCIDAGCSDLCLLAPKSQRRGYTCHCPQNKVLAPNNHACEQVLKSLSLVVGAGNTLMEVEHQHLGRLSATPLPLRDVYKIGAIAYNAFNGKFNNQIIQFIQPLNTNRQQAKSSVRVIMYLGSSVIMTKKGWILGEKHLYSKRLNSSKRKN